MLVFAGRHDGAGAGHGDGYGRNEMKVHAKSFRHQRGFTSMYATRMRLQFVGVATRPLESIHTSW